MKKMNFSKAKKLSQKMSAGVLTTGTLLSSKLASFAGTTVTVKNPGDPTAKLGSIVGMLIDIVMYAGVAVVAFGVFELGIALFAEGQADKKPKAVIAIVAGVIMCAVKYFLTLVGVI